MPPHRSFKIDRMIEEYNRKLDEIKTKEENKTAEESVEDFGENFGGKSDE